MPLEPLDYVNGIFGTFFVIISIFLGIKIIFKYFKVKDINLLLVGLFILLISCGWYGTSASFIVAFITDGEGLSYVIIMLLNFVPLPIAFLSWITAFTNFLYKEKQKIILIGCIIYVVLVFSTFLYFLFTEPALVGEKISPVDTKANNLFFVIVLITVIIIILITGIKFALETIKYDEPEMKVKGKLLLVAFLSFCIGGLLDALMPTIAITLVIFRLILISSAIEYYGAFILPNWMKKMFLR